MQRNRASGRARRPGASRSRPRSGSFARRVHCSSLADRRPSRAVRRKFVFSSIVVKPVAPSGRCATVPYRPGVRERDDDSGVEVAVRRDVLGPELELGADEPVSDLCDDDAHELGKVSRPSSLKNPTSRSRRRSIACDTVSQAAVAPARRVGSTGCSRSSRFAPAARAASRGAPARGRARDARRRRRGGGDRRRRRRRDRRRAGRLRRARAGREVLDDPGGGQGAAVAAGLAELEGSASSSTPTCRAPAVGLNALAVPPRLGRCRARRGRRRDDERARRCRWPSVFSAALRGRERGAVRAHAVALDCRSRTSICRISSRTSTRSRTSSASTARAGAGQRCAESHELIVPACEGRVPLGRRRRREARSAGSTTCSRRAS